jgi:hypothetical protein
MLEQVLLETKVPNVLFTDSMMRFIAAVSAVNDSIDRAADALEGGDATLGGIREYVTRQIGLAQVNSERISTTFLEWLREVSEWAEPTLRQAREARD